MLNNFKYKVRQTLNIWFDKNQERFIKYMTENLSKQLFETSGVARIESVMRPYFKSVCDFANLDATIKKMEDLKKEYISRTEAEFVLALSKLDAAKKYCEDRKNFFKGNNILDPEQSANNKNETDVTNVVLDKNENNK